MASPTPNKGYTYPAHGGAVNAWDTPLNTNFDQIDLNVAGYYPITISSTVSTVTYNSSGALVSSTAATVTPPSSLAQNLTYVFSGALTQNLKLVLPAAGGYYAAYNNTTGSFTVTIGSSTGTSATIQQGGTNTVFCYDGANFILSNSNPNAAQLYTYLGNPNGSVAGTAGATNGSLTNVIWDKTNQQIYVTTTGSSLAASTVWTPKIDLPMPGGILTVSNSTTSPVVATSTTATSIYYTPLLTNWTLLSTGTILYLYQFSQMTLTLSASQAANQIYDIFLYHNNGTPVIGTGPAWTTATAGSGNRGTGAGTTQLSRLQGILVNTVQVTLTNGASTYVCPASQGVYLGSIYVDSAAGNVTCHTAYGQSRKWGVWNFFNRHNIDLQAGDATASWIYNTNTARASNGNSANSLTTFCGYAEEDVTIQFYQRVYGGTNGANNDIQINTGIGVNSTTVMSGQYGVWRFGSNGGDGSFTSGGTAVASHLLSPGIGINTITSLEQSVNSGTGNNTFYGTNNYMVLRANWMG